MLRFLYMTAKPVSIIWAHQLPFSNVLVPMHVVLYHLLPTKHTTISIFWVSRSVASKSAGPHTHLIFLGNEAVYDEHLQSQLPAQLADVLQKVLDLSVVLLLQIGHLTRRHKPSNCFPENNSAMGLKNVSDSTHFWLGSHQHGPHFFQFLGFSLSFLLQTRVFLFYVQAFLLIQGQVIGLLDRCPLHPH